jgi:hypothetical protein
MQNIRWARVSIASVVGLFVVAIAFGIWYGLLIWLPARQDQKMVLDAQQSQKDFQSKYCTTGQYKNESVRKICLDISQ